MNATRTAVLAFSAFLLFAGIAQPVQSEPPPQTTDQRSPDTAGAHDQGVARTGERPCGIVLGPELDGHFFVHDAHGVLVADLYKPGGRAVELGLQPGTYDVVYEQEPLRLDAKVTLEDRERKTLERASFRPVERVEVPGHHHAAVEKPGGLFMDGRTRVELFGGFTDSYVEVETGGGHVAAGGGQGGLAFSHWLREDLALEFQWLATDVDVVDFEDVPWESTQTRGSMGLLFGARYYFPKAAFGGTFRPYAAAAIGPFSEYYAYSSHHYTEVHHNSTRFGAQVAGGVDFQLSRLFSLGVRVGVTFRDGYDPSFGTTFGVGFAWGKGHRGLPADRE